jgi:hypothetical protein
VLDGSVILASKEIGLEVNADETKYMVRSRDQNAGRRHDIMTDNNSFESLEHFRYLRTKLSNQNSIQEKIKSRVKSRSYSVQNLLSSKVISKI